MAAIRKHRAELPGTMYGRVCGILESARLSAARSVNTAQVIANWRVGREIVEEEQQGRKRAGYAERVIALLSERLKKDYGAGYSAQNLAYMKQFYLAYPALLAGGTEEEEIFHAVRGKSKTATTARALSSADTPEIFHAVRGKSQTWRPGHLHQGLSWTHYRTLLRVDTVEARCFYEIEAARYSWSARELERQIDSLLFERLARSRNQKEVMRLATKGQVVTSPLHIFKDPMVIEFLDIPKAEVLAESTLETALIGNLQSFLLELGKGFAFVSRQERITLDGDHFYIDLVFYHMVLKCYVLIDLKVGKLSHSDMGQMQFYVNYFDRERRSEGDNATLGLILSTNRNDAVVHYTLGAEKERKIFASRYQLHLPTTRELEREIRREVKLLAPAAAVPAKKAAKKALPLKNARPLRRR